MCISPSARGLANNKRLGEGGPITVQCIAKHSAHIFVHVTFCRVIGKVQEGAVKYKNMGATPVFLKIVLELRGPRPMNSCLVFNIEK